MLRKLSLTKNFNVLKTLTCSAGHSSASPNTAEQASIGYNFGQQHILFSRSSFTSTIQLYILNIFCIIAIKELTPEQKEYRDVARKFALEEIIPKAAHHDKTGEVLINNYYFFHIF